MSLGEILYLLGAFFLGAVPFGFVIGRLKGVDIRSVGSGNIGATNVGRMLGRTWGILVFGLDFLKGFVPVMGLWLWGASLGLAGGPGDPVARAAGSFAGGSIPGIGLSLSVAAGLAAILGHIYSPFLALRGGKGVATSLGAFVALAPVESLLAVAAWAVVLRIWRYMALASLVGAWLFPLLLALVRGPAAWREQGELLVVSLVLALIITWRHRSNIMRLMHGEEAKIGSKSDGAQESCGGRR